MGWDDAQDEALDELLRRAAWPEAQSGQVERLEGHWRQVVRRRRHRIALSVAAGVIVPVLCAAVAIVISAGRHFAELPGPSAVEDAPAVAERDETLTSPPSHEQIVRDPNIYEQSIALLYRQRASSTERLATRPEPTSELRMNATADAARPLQNAAGAEKKDADEPPVDELFAAMSSSKVSVRLSAARTLGEMNDPAVSHRLAQMALENVSRREALVALMASSDTVARTFLAYAERDLTLAATMRALPRALERIR